MQADIDQKTIKSIISYDPDSGKFSWISDALQGKRFGCIHKGYLTVKISNKPFFAHRLAFLYMTGQFPPDSVDHIDGDTTNNRWENLRPVDRAENGKNMKVGARNKSGVMGVFWRNESSNWRAYIKVGRKQLHLGTFHDFFLAVCARKSAEIANGFHANHGRAI